VNILDIFKRKETGTSSLTSKGGINPPPTTPRPEPPTAEAVPKKTDAEMFEEWYSSLTPAERKKADKKMEKLFLRAGTPVCCKKCGKSGSNKVTGPFRKIEDGYVHQNCMTGGVNG
jgi:hypothetical protein